MERICGTKMHCQHKGPHNECSNRSLCAWEYRIDPRDTELSAYRALGTVDELAAALREKSARDNPQPLSIEELRERDGKPVYSIRHKKWGIYSNKFYSFPEMYGIEGAIDLLNSRDELIQVFDHEPKEATP